MYSYINKNNSSNIEITQPLDTNSILKNQSNYRNYYLFKQINCSKIYLIITGNNVESAADSKSVPWIVKNILMSFSKNWNLIN